MAIGINSSANENNDKIFNLYVAVLRILEPQSVINPSAPPPEPPADQPQACQGLGSRVRILSASLIRAEGRHAGVSLLGGGEAEEAV